MKDWISFNICIFNSPVIKSLYKALYGKQNDNILDESELTNILENICYYTFETHFKGLTMKKTKKLYEYVPLIEDNTEDSPKLIYLAFCLNINQREIIGNYNIGYQAYSQNKNKQKKSTEYTKESDDVELGENIEIKLYGRVINSLTLKGALFILNLSNYNTDYETFRQKFEKCNDNNSIIDDTLRDILINVFKIEPNNLHTKNFRYNLGQLSKKYVKRIACEFQGKHPLGFDMDGKYL